MSETRRRAAFTYATWIACGCRSRDITVWSHELDVRQFTEKF